MNDHTDIKQTLARLSTSDRSQIALWLYELRESEGRQSRVAEQSVAYNEAIRHMTVDEYLDFEQRSAVRHEYVAGDVYAMSGASREHNRIATRLLLAFESHLRDGPCETHISDVKVRIKSDVGEHFYYPDLMVNCDLDRHEPRDATFLRYPRLIVEVLSPSTEGIDRREKSLTYRRIETLEEYVLVAQEGCEVTICRRAQNWRPVVLNSIEERAEFRSIQLTLPVAHFYEDEPILPA